MLQAALLDGLAFDFASLSENGLLATEVNISWRHVAEAFVVSVVVVVVDEGFDLGFKIAGKIIVFE